MESVQNEDPSDSKIVQAGQEPEAVTRWVCVYDPTFNRDWHDDVLCSKGNKHKRPYLRAKDRFVTEDEIMRAAEKYENKLNAGRR